jgi:hypothetical protein
MAFRFEEFTDNFPVGMGEKFRHAGFSSDEPQQIIAAELYCGRD